MISTEELDAEVKAGAKVYVGSRWALGHKDFFRISGKEFVKVLAEATAQSGKPPMINGEVRADGNIYIFG